MTLAKAAPSSEFTRQRMDALLAGAEASMKVAFLELVAYVAGSLDVAEVAAWMASGNIGQALISTEKMAIGLTGAWAEAYTGAGRDAAMFMGQALQLPVHFDQTNTRAVAAVQGTQLKLIREVTDQQRDVFRRIIADGVRQGINPREVARELRESVGLTNYQEQVVRNYRALLEKGSAQALDRQLRDARFDSRVRRAIDSGKAIPPSDIDRMVSRYRERWVNFRAETIARTEGLRAASQGVQAGFMQAVQAGDLKGNEIERTWITRHDGRQRDWHETMHGQRRGLTEPFIDGLGNLLNEPRDPTAPAETTIECRCRLTYRLK